MSLSILNYIQGIIEAVMENPVHYVPKLLLLLLVNQRHAFVDSQLGGTFMTPEMVTEVSQSGLVSVQSHTHTHPNLAWLTPQQQERDKLPQVIPAGPNVLAIAAWLYENLYGKKREKRLARKKALEKVRKQEAELQERWDSLEKK